MCMTLVAVGAFAETKEVSQIKKQVESCLEKNYSNMGMKMCFNAGLQKAEAVLKKTVKKVKSLNIDEKEILSRLDASQVAWEKYSDAYCALEATQMLGGTGETLIQSSCLLDLTNKRNDYLTEMFIEFGK